MKIIFFGTPDFAVPSLQAIVKAGYDVVAVVTVPDKPAGRGLKLIESPVKKAAQDLGLLILQPEKLKAKEFIEQLQVLNCDLQIVIAFRMLPEIVWNMPSLGTFNLHASLLPEYRGAAPINRAIMNGETKTGLTTFFLKHEIDTGNIITQMEIDIHSNETAGQLHDRMMIEGAGLVVKSLDIITSGNLQLTPQKEHPLLKHAPKIFTEDCNIQWQSNCINIYNQIRGLSPYPCAFTTLNQEVFKIYEADYITTPIEKQPGYTIIEKHEMKIATTDGWILPKIVQAAGKKRMNIRDYLNGLHNYSSILAGS